jgi:hypothetical protein
MVFGMSRDPLQTVTLPIIVDAAGEKGGADGWATCFPHSNHIKETAVRKVNPEEVLERRRKIFTPEEFSVYVGAQQLKQAYDRADEFKFREGFERVRSRLAVSNIAGVQVQWRMPGLTTESDRVGVRWMYSNLMSNVLQDARLVMWCSDKEQRFLPGIYCPDWKTAAFVHLFMKHILVCPKCNEPFIPKTDNQGYCSPGHGVAHRTFRSRWNKKQKAANQKRNTRRSLRRLTGS